MAFILMSDDAVNAFKSGNKITLDADAGFTIVNWSADAEASWGKADVVTWSDTEGLSWRRFGRCDGYQLGR